MKWFRSSGKTEDYEKEYLTRYNEQQEPKQKKNTSKDKKSIKKEPEALSTKLESAKQEYSYNRKFDECEKRTKECKRDYSRIE